MNDNNLYYLQASEDITILSLNTKLLIVENTFINQKRVHTYVSSYVGSTVMGISRNSSKMVTLLDALINSGFSAEVTEFTTNASLQENLVQAKRPFIQVFDFFYFDTGTLLSDGSQIVFQ